MSVEKNKNSSISIREAARKYGVSHTAINKAIELGRFTKCVDRSGNKNRIYPDEFVEEAAEIGFKLKGDQGGMSDVSNLTDEEKKSIEALTVDTATLKESKRREAYYMSELARLEFEEKNGTLQNKADTYKQLFDYGSEIKTRILSIPDRITDELISLADDRDAFYNLFYRSQRDALDLLSRIDTVLD